MEQISVFDIFKICIGTYSSHTMGPWLAANRFIKQIKVHKVQSINIQLFGSLAETGHGHGVEMALMMGLSQFDISYIKEDQITNRNDNENNGPNNKINNKEFLN